MVVYQAPIVVLGIVAMIVLRWVALEMDKPDEKQNKRVRNILPTVHIPLWARYWTWLMLFIVVLIAQSLLDIFSDIMAQSNWLDPETTTTFVKESLAANQESNRFDEWYAEASLDDYQWLRWFSMLSPLWVVLTLFLCIFHCIEHINKIKQRWWNSDRNDGKAMAPRHDMTILILFLPLFYSTMSLKSVVRMWQVCIDHMGALKGKGAASVFTSFDERKAFLFEMYEANFLVGDVYETYALIIFGRLVNLVLAGAIQKAEAPPIPGEKHEHKLDAHSLYVTMQSLMLDGVKLFNYSCIGQAVYYCIVTQFGLLGWFPTYCSPSLENPGLLQTEETKNMVANIFLGSGFVASFAAIGNIMKVEHKFEHALENFKPSGKFWGTKILVSLAFMQSMLLKVLPPFATYSETRNNLFYSSILCIECFFVALLHRCAWGADEAWYDDDKKLDNDMYMLLD